MTLAELTYDELLARAAPFMRAAGEQNTGAMVALVPSAADAARLAVPGGEDAGQLHVTLMYLGEAAGIPDDARALIVDRMGVLAAAERAPLEVDGFAVSMFNPAGPNPCVVLGLTGADLDAIHDAAVAGVAEAAAGLFDMPAQHRPWVAHLTLEYTADPGRVEALVDRAGPVTLDRLRVAFAGEAVDFPLGPSLRRRAARYVHLRYSDDQERDDNGRFAGAGGGGGGGSSSGGVGAVSRDEFEGRVSSAVTGADALESAALRDEDLTNDQRAAIDKYGGDASYVINEDLRTTGVPKDRHEATVEHLDEVMGDFGGLPEDSVVYRNVMGQDVFGESFSEDMTGVQWRDAGYVSTSANERPAFYQATTMRILAPAGTPGFSHPNLDRDEILLGRGLTFEVVSDNGTSSAIRHLDVMVVGS